MSLYILYIYIYIYIYIYFINSRFLIPLSKFKVLKTPLLSLTRTGLLSCEEDSNFIEWQKV